MKSFVAVFEQFEKAFNDFVLEKKSPKKDKLFAKTDNVPDNGIKEKAASKVGSSQANPRKTVKLGGNKQSA